MEMQHPTKLDRLMHAVAEHYPLRAAISFAINDFGVRVESNSPPLIAAMREHFAAQLCEIRVCDMCVVAIQASAPELGFSFQDWSRERTSVSREQYVDIDGGRVVRKPKSGLQFLLGPDISLAVGACAEHPHQLIELVNARYMERLAQRGWLACQAAGVAVGERGIAICGPSGSGKSTLALSLLERVPGATLLSSDRLMIQASAGGARAAGSPNAVRVNPGTLLRSARLRALLSAERVRELESLAISDLWALEDKRSLPLHDLFGRDPSQLMASIGALVVLHWQPARFGALEWQRCKFGDRPELASLLARRPGPFCRGQRAARSQVIDLAPFLHQLAELPVLELRGRVDFEAASELCQDLLV